MHNFPADGTYNFQLLLHGEPTGFLFGRTQREIQMEVAIDGERVALLKVDRWMSEADPQGLTVSTGRSTCGPGRDVWRRRSFRSSRARKTI